MDSFSAKQISISVVLSYDRPTPMGEEDDGDDDDIDENDDDDDANRPLDLRAW